MSDPVDPVDPVVAMDRRVRRGITRHLRLAIAMCSASATGAFIAAATGVVMLGPAVVLAINGVVWAFVARRCSETLGAIEHRRKIVARPPTSASTAGRRTR